MKEYIKKFPTLASADGYVIDAPFISAIYQEQGDPILLRCSANNKRIVIDDGVPTVVNMPELVHFTVRYLIDCGYGYTDSYVEFNEQAVQGMTWSDFVDSAYNHEEEFYYGPYDYVKSYDKCFHGNWKNHADYAVYFGEEDPIGSDFRGWSDSEILSGNDIVLEDGKTYYYWHQGYCLLGDTEVTMGDGTIKQIKDIQLGDEVLSLDLETGEQVVRKVIYTDAAMNKQVGIWDEWKFSDGTVLKTAHRHEFYNVEVGKLKYMDEWQIGDHAYKIDGTTPELVEHIVHNEAVNHYKITLEGSNNFFANSLLNGDRYCNEQIKKPLV